MIDHLSSYATDFDATKAFYDAALGALGFQVVTEMVMDWDQELPGRRACAYGDTRPIFWVIETKVEYTPRHLAFTAADHAGVDAFHTAGLAAGGTDHGAPGPRPVYHEHYYGGFLLDPDGNNVEAVCHAPTTPWTPRGRIHATR